MVLKLSFKLDYTREWSDWYCITPADAEALLALNTINREVRAGLVKSYAGAMKRGEWSRTHQGIAISRTGQILDGQHRLLGIVAAGVSVDMMIVTGLENPVFRDIDKHGKRSNADSFRENKFVMEPINMGAKLVYSGNPTAAQMEPVYAALLPIVGPLIANKGRRKVITSAPMVLAAAVTILEGGDADYVTTLFDKLRVADFDSLPPVGLAFMKQVLDGSATPTKTYDLIARGLLLFDAAKKDTTRIIVKDAALAAERVRAALRPLVSEHTTHPELDLA
jgi:hypothetical protein